jgi:hypothetical protein
MEPEVHCRVHKNPETLQPSHKPYIISVIHFNTSLRSGLSLSDFPTKILSVFLISQNDKTR